MCRLFSPPVHPLLHAQSPHDILKSYEHGYASYQQGKYQEALSSYERSLQLARQAKLPQKIAANLMSTERGESRSARQVFSW